MRDKVLGHEVELRKLHADGVVYKGDRIYSGKTWDDRDVQSGAWTAYEVLVEGTRIGVVASYREENATTHNRIRYVRGVTRYWQAVRGGRDVVSKRRVGYHFYSRRDAVEGLVREVFG